MPKTKTKRDIKFDKKMLYEDDSMLIEEDSQITEIQTRRRASTIDFASPIPKGELYQESAKNNQKHAFKGQKRRYTSVSCKEQEETHDHIYFNQVFDKLRGYHLGDFLTQHDIEEKFRAKMIDWMIEVLNIYRQKKQTLFKAVFILDLYYKTKTEKISLEELHLNGIVSMMIASKSEEVNFIKLDAVVDTIGRKKFTKTEIMMRELEILSSINFRTNFPTMYELLRCAFRFVKFDCSEADEFFKKSAFRISQMCLFSYELMVNLTIQEIALFSIVIGYKLAKKVMGFGNDKSVS